VSNPSSPTTTGGASDDATDAWLIDQLLQSTRRADEAAIAAGEAPSAEGLAELDAEFAALATGVEAAANTPPAPAPAAAPAPTAESASAAAPAAEPAPTTGQVAARTTALPAKTTPVPADAPTSPVTRPTELPAADEPSFSVLRGPAKALATHMDASLTVPTATTVRSVPAKLLIDNRIVINNHLTRTRGGKVSFTHLIAWAMVRALKEFPSQSVYYDEIDGKPAIVTPAHINLGIAIDIPKPDGTRALVVPGIKRAETMTFSEFVAAYEDVVARGRANALTVDDLTGNTISLTNPGGLGTVHSIPRLMKGAGCIIGAGALEYPAEFQGTSERTLAELGIGKTITLTSTYDHRVIQGAGSGEYLRKLHEFLIGQRDFYEDIFASLRIPYEPIRWAEDVAVDPATQIDKTGRVQQLINAYRVRGHLMADIDPLEYVQRGHPDLDIASHGLTFWDLDREFVVGGFGGRRSAKLRDVLGILRDTYCRTVGIEYMHIPDPEQRRWFQERLEVKYEKPTRDEQMRILGKLNQAEAFETFLQTKFVGQKRFSLEGGESTIPLLDEILQNAAAAELDGAAIGMAHRGRLNVLTNIAGKTYSQIFREFEGDFGTAGSGDVKYHLGTEGLFESPDGKSVPLYVAANPSHLEVVNAVLEGIVRAKQDRRPIGTFTTLPIAIHGDAALAGQGINVELLQMSQLRAYRTGGTIHVNINNQVGFTTSPSEARTSIYSTDVAKTIQAPVFHVNGDDPEAVVRVAKLAFDYRQRFHADVVIDLICYRRRGHNEGDDPSMTQPLMYQLIEAKRSTRKLYTEALVGRGDITQEEFEASQQDFQERLERAFLEMHVAQTAPIPIITDPAPAGEVRVEIPPVGETAIQLIGDAHANEPEGFTVHPKLAQNVIGRRVEMARTGGIDWGFGELLALGSLVLEGTAVRLVGQDARRGTFAHRHAMFFDQKTGQEWLPLANLAEHQARFYVYDSLLSEYAAMAFEYGYSVERADALVIWEAQYGDFADGAQIVIDTYLASGEQKWGQSSSVVLLLPHGYEGQGPDHSSARMERYLQMCAEDNMTVTRPSTPANYFHLLRRQAYDRPRRPLIVFSPKSMLRLKSATSDVADFTTGGFQEVIDDTRIASTATVQKVLLVSGKLYYDLLAELERQPEKAQLFALVRIEQLYPAPVEQLRAAVARYPHADLTWVQDEPENQGAWPFVNQLIAPQLDKPVSVVSRPASAATATGLPKRHAAEQARLMEEALAL